MAVSLLSRHVTAFLTCAKEGSFSKAAGKMYISPTALIAQIDLFESRLGFKLFERSPRGLKLTPQGQSLFEDAKRLTEESANAIRRAYLQGLEDNFNEMLLNMIKRQAAMSIVAPLIENMQKELEKYINKDDTDLTISEAEKFAEYVKNQLPEVSAALENLFNGLKDVGLEFGDAGDTMSSLQRGISSVSEETAQALEALLNSMRFFVSDSNTVLHNIYNAIAMPNVENPFLTELKVQSNYLNNLNALVSSVIKNSSGKGKVLRVEIA